MLPEFNPTLLHGDDLMELGMGELKWCLRRRAKGMFIYPLLFLPMGHLFSCYISLQCNSRQEDLHVLVRDRNKIKLKTEARDISSVWLKPWWGQGGEGWLGVFIFAERLCCGFVILKWICPAWEYCQELHVCFLWCFAQYCSRLPLCKINLLSICAPYIGFNYGEASLQNQVSRSTRDSAHAAASESSYACSYPWLVQTSGGCSATGRMNEFKLLLCL